VSVCLSPAIAIVTRRGGVVACIPVHSRRSIDALDRAVRLIDEKRELDRLPLSRVAADPLLIEFGNAASIWRPRSSCRGWLLV